jgi:hypothetical protein
LRAFRPSVGNATASYFFATEARLPEAFGEWNSAFRRFSRWSRKGIWWRIFEGDVG